jgi:subtilisin family serine protease
MGRLQRATLISRAGYFMSLLRAEAHKAMVRRASTGTFVAGILSAKRGSVAPAICPDCALIIRPIFAQAAVGESLPSATPEELATAILDCMNAGARVINLSLALAQPSINGIRALEEAFEGAVRSGVIVVAAAGNQGAVGSSAITRHP